MGGRGAPEPQPVVGCAQGPGQGPCVELLVLCPRASPVALMCLSEDTLCVLDTALLDAKCRQRSGAFILFCVLACQLDLL